MFFLFRTLALLCFFQPSFALYFQNQLGESQDIIDQAAQELAKKFPAVCVIKSFPKDKNADVNKIPARSTNGVLFHVNKETNTGYVLTYAKQFFEDDTSPDETEKLMHQADQRRVVLWFGSEGSNSGPKEGPVHGCRGLHFMHDKTTIHKYTIAIITFDLPPYFNIQPIPLYDGQGYKAGKPLGAVLTSYGLFNQHKGQEKIDYIRRAGITKVQYLENQVGKVLAIPGAYNPQKFPEIQPTVELEICDNQAWPYKQDGGSPLILKTLRGYQLAGIYSGLNIHPTIGMASHYWYFVPANKDWIDTVLTHCYNQ